MDGISTSGITDKDLIEVKDFEDNIQGVLAKFGQKLQDDLIKSLDKKKKNASGDLRQSIQAVPDVSISDGIYTYVLSMADYYEQVDKGRGTGGDPYKLYPQFIKWAFAKKALGGLPKAPSDASGLKSYAFNVAKKVTKFGFKPSYFFTNVIDDGRLEQLTEDLATAGAEGFTLDNR
jgi:hypothetical protein